MICWILDVWRVGDIGDRNLSLGGCLADARENQMDIDPPGSTQTAVAAALEVMATDLVEATPPTRPRWSRRPPKIPGFVTFNEEAAKLGITPTQLRRRVKAGTYPAPSDIVVGGAYPDDNAQRVAAQRFAERNAQ